MEQTHKHYRGLSDAEVSESRRLHGDNILTPPEREPLWRQFLKKFTDPIIVILLVALALSVAVAFYQYFVLSHDSDVFLEPAGILASVILATVVGFCFEVSAERKFEILNKVDDDTPVKVIRNGNISQIAKHEVVVGDIIVLGTGEEKYEHLFRHFAWKYSNRVSANIFYSNERSHRIYAACDAFLMPSLFEPCGLSQLMSLRYGTVPIVRETGGLRDTVQPYNQYEGTGTGFGFCNYNAHEMLGTVRYAKDVYYNHRREWNKIIDRGMAADFSWSASARKYEDLYNRM